jgi:hypothetical protein
MCKAADDLKDLADLGKDPVLPIHAKTAAFKFVGLLYGHHNCTSLNALRSSQVLFKKRVRPRKLPPTNDSFVLHLLRCIYQLFVWRSSLKAIIPPLDPLDFGYLKDEKTGMYKPQLMTQPPAAPELLSDLVCNCSNLCSDDCVCSGNEQPCTIACSCKGVLQGQICENLFTMLANVETDDYGDDDCL